MFTSMVDLVQQRPLPGDDGRKHVVQFYESAEFLASVVADFVAAGLSSGEPAVLIATPAHGASVRERLLANGVEVAQAEASGRLVFLDARECLDRFMVQGSPDPERFHAVIEPVLLDLRRAGTSDRVRAFGEMVDVLWRDGEREAAIRLEELWTDLARGHAFTLLCGYAMSNFVCGEDTEAFERICHSHQEVRPSERSGTAPSTQVLGAELARLEQRTRALETELQHRKALEQGLRDALAERRRTEQALLASREELSDFLENAVEGIHAVGPDGIILWANRAELDLLGYTREEYVGRPISDFHVDADNIQDILTCLRNNQTLRDRETRLRCKDGSIKDVLVSSNVARRDGKFLHTRCFSRDVTERRKLEVELQQRNEELSRAVRFSELFVGMLGHDLRNPLSAVTTTAGLLSRREEPEVVARAKRILNSAGRMARMIDQLLDFTRIRVGKGFTLVRRPLSLAELCRQGIDELATDEARARVELSVQGDATGEWDHDRLMQLFTNLLGNALTHGEAAAPVVVRVDGTADQMVRLEVKNGGTLPPALLPTLFEPLRVTTKSVGSSGVGLGLFISQQIARTHLGELTAHSNDGSTAFVLQLPRRPNPTELR